MDSPTTSTTRQEPEQESEFFEHKATNHAGWEIQTYHNEKWSNLQKNSKGEPLIFEKAPIPLLNYMRSMAADVPEGSPVIQYRIYESLKEQK